LRITIRKTSSQTECRPIAGVYPGGARGRTDRPLSPFPYLEPVTTGHLKE
jgi:hypothetical protein